MAARRQSTKTPTTSGQTDTLVVTRPAVVRPEGLEPADRVRAEVARLSRIVTQADADAAGLFVQEARRRVKAIRAHYKRVVFDPIKRALDAATADAKREMAADLTPLEEADKTLTPVIESWLAAEEARIEAEQRAALEAAQEAAAAQRTQTVEALRSAAAEAETATERRALTAQARAVQAAPLLPVLSASSRPDVAAVAGVSVRRAKKAEVRDFAALVAAVAAGRVALAALLPNEEWLDDRAEAAGRDMGIPGVVVVDVRSLAAKPEGRR